MASLLGFSSFYDKISRENVEPVEHGRIFLARKESLFLLLSVNSKAAVVHLE